MNSVGFPPIAYIFWAPNKGGDRISYASDIYSDNLFNLANEFSRVSRIAYIMERRTKAEIESHTHPTFIATVYLIRISNSIDPRKVKVLCSLVGS